MFNTKKGGHHHRGLSQRHLRENYRNIFKPELHSSRALVKHVVAFSKLRGAAMTPLQTRAMHLFRNEAIYNLTNEGPSDIDVLTAYCNFFNDVFFFGALKGNLDFELSKENARKVGMAAFKEQDKKQIMQQRLGRGAIYYTEKQCIITIFSRELKTSRRPERLMIYLSMLLHGMAHAFLAVFACHHEKCIGKKGENICLHSHTVAWQDIAHAIETAVRDRHIALKLTLNRVDSLAQELRKSGRVMFTAEELHRWGIDYGTLKRSLDIQTVDPSYEILSRRACL